MSSPVRAGAAGSKIDSIIELARCADHHRILLAGARNPDAVSGWRRRGYRRAVTIAGSPLPRGQYDVAVVEWRKHSIRALESTLDWLVHFLSPRGMLVVWVDGASDAPSARRSLRAAIERLGFHVEAGKRRQNGFVLSASRRLPAGRQGNGARRQPARRASAAAPFTTAAA